MIIKDKSKFRTLILMLDSLYGTHFYATNYSNVKKHQKKSLLRLLMRSSLTKIALRYLDAGVAQLVEQLTCNQPVGGSTPLASSIFFGKAF